MKILLSKVVEEKRNKDKKLKRWQQWFLKGVIQYQYEISKKGCRKKIPNIRHIICNNTTI